ncbi:MAG: electron transfer flavoprotein subunit alpha/FixB family protein [Bradymonadia bacterium]
MSDIIVLAEQQNGKLSKATLNAISAAKALGGVIGSDGFDIALAGQGVDGVAEELSAFGNVHYFEHAALEKYTAQAYAQAMHQAVEASGAKYVIAAATAIGKDMTPRVAARLGAGMASDVLAFEGDDDEVIYKRPMYAGNIIAKVKINTDTQVLTVRTTEFDVAAPAGGGSVNKAAANIDTGNLRMKYLGLDAVESERPDLTEADVVVAGGRGLKEASNFSLIEKLADLMGGAIGATRAVCDAGWVPNDWQVGQTGKVVAPNLYFAIGVSGAIQHLAGMKGSKTIVAINKDPDAPIFSVADYGLVADLFDVMPELTEKVASRTKG